MKKTEKAIKNEAKYAFIKPADTALRVIRCEASVAIEVWSIKNGEATKRLKIVYLEPNAAVTFGENIIDSARGLLQ